MSWVHYASPSEEVGSRFRLLVILSVLSTVAATVVIISRFAKRWPKYGSDDYWALFSLSLSIIYNVFTIVETRYGLGLPLAMRPPEDLYMYRTINFYSRPFYLGGIAAFKISLCMSSLRITDNTDMVVYRRTVYVVAWLSGVLQLIFIGVNLGNCSPYAKNFHPKMLGHCLPYGPVNWTIATMTILCDCFVFLNPIWVIQGLRIGALQKSTLYAGFILGFVTTVFSILRMTNIPSVASKGGDSTMLVVYSDLEVNAGVISTSLPIFIQPLVNCVRRLQGKLVLTNKSSPGVPTYNLSTLESSAGNRVGKTGHNSSQEDMLVTDLEYEPRASDRIMKSVNVTILSQPAASRGLSDPATIGLAGTRDFYGRV